jgi:hypothetical protein
VPAGLAVEQQRQDRAILRSQKRSRLEYIGGQEVGWNVNFCQGKFSVEANPNDCGGFFNSLRIFAGGLGESNR